MATQLNDLLDGLLDLGADRVTLEWTSDGLEVTMFRGPTGVGTILKNPLAATIIRELVTRAKLERRTRGILEAKIHDRQLKFVVKEYDHFGESAFEIRVRS